MFGLFQGDTVDSEHLSEITESEAEVSFAKPSHKGFVRIDARYLIPFFTRKFTQQVSEASFSSHNFYNLC